MNDKLRIFQINERSILVEFDEEINENLLNHLLSLKNKLQDSLFEIKAFFMMQSKTKSIAE